MSNKSPISWKWTKKMNPLNPSEHQEPSSLAPAQCSESSCDEDEELIQQCLAVLRGDKAHAGISIMQRRLRLGYARAARIMDELERRGNVGPAKGFEARVVF